MLCYCDSQFFCRSQGIRLTIFVPKESWIQTTCVHMHAHQETVHYVPCYYTTFTYYKMNVYTPCTLLTFISMTHVLLFVLCLCKSVYIKRSGYCTLPSALYITRLLSKKLLTFHTAVLSIFSRIVE